MKTDNHHPLEANFPAPRTPSRLFDEQGPREKLRNERSDAERSELRQSYDKPISKAQKFLLF